MADDPDVVQMPDFMADNRRKAIRVTEYLEARFSESSDPDAFWIVETARYLQAFVRYETSLLRDAECPAYHVSMLAQEIGDDRPPP